MNDEERKFAEGMCSRVKMARKEAGYTQETMAEALGVPFHTYTKYESRSPMKQMYIGRFCELTGVSSWYNLTGEPKSPGQEGLELEDGLDLLLNQIKKYIGHSKLSTSEMALINGFRDLHKNEQQTIKELVASLRKKKS